MLILIGTGYSQWVANFGSQGDLNFTNSKGNAVSTDISGNSYVTGYTNETGTGNDIVAIKYNSQGNVVWASGYNGSSNLDDEGNGIYVDASGNVYVVGSTQNNNKGYDVTLVKYNSAGMLQWTQTYFSAEDMPREDKGLAISADGAGFIYVTGYTTYTDGLTDIITLKYDASGTKVWEAREDGTPNLNAQGLAITAGSSGNVYVTGFITASGTNTDIIVIKYNSSGQTVWSKTINGTTNGEDKAWGIAVDNTDNVLITGYTNESATGFDTYTAKLDANGNIIWSSRYNGSGAGEDKAWGVVVDTDGAVYIAGQTTDASGNSNYLTAKYSSSGSLIWNASYNGTGNGSDIGASLAILTNNDNTKSVVVTGKSWGTTNNFDYATVRYNSTSGGQNQVNRYSMTGATDDLAKDVAISPSKKVIVTGYSELIMETSIEHSYISTVSWDWESELNSIMNVPSDYTLHQNYPNPFNPSTNIKFDIKNAGNVKITVYDMLGKMVDILVNQHLEAGTHEITFRNSSLASGIYFYEIQTGYFRDIKKMTLVK